MDVEKICRTCLSLSGPFLSIYDGGTGSCLVDMLREFTRTKVSLGFQIPDAPDSIPVLYSHGARIICQPGSVLVASAK